MHLKKHIFIIHVLIFSPAFIFAQGQIDKEQKVGFRNEISGSVYLTSNGYGINFSYARRLDGFRKRLYTVDLAEIKHSKETKTSNPYLPNNNRFVYGKLNNFYNLRFGWGLQKEIFSKKDKNSVSIRYFYTLGPSLGMLKPIYYRTLNSKSFYSEVETEKFDRDKHMRSNIVGEAAYLKGFDELKFSVGVNARAGFTFEFSEKKTAIHALEAGLIADFFMNKIEIMAVDKNEYNFMSKLEQNEHLFIGLFVAFRFGKTIKATGRKGQL